ncbi:VWA domain-containing protein [Candidatus Viridilinea mediisalina]|uniref:VWFA domain-containing protein n=1 Tax=Candidatus Viridilinea mediisalina TaxID=2024553 RepID=A0A2A6RFM5_9CHLR|nr:VWA domain-containing protein [Candidatus Viridilinea mediisalina]PDW01822.1 hypothetical protein CJ255_17195 [Candidatus Viridilinea mediisalina]
MRRLLFVALGLALLLPSLAFAQTIPQAQIDTYGLRIDGRTVEVLFRVTDRATGRDVQGLQSRDIRLLENNVLINASVDLVEAHTDAANPMRTVDMPAVPSGALPVSGSQPVELNVVGATIGIVFDASLLTNVAGDPTDYVARGRGLITDFLEAGRPIAPSNPEQIGLFIPLSVPTVAGEQIRPSELPNFVQDRNAVINTLNQMAPRSGKTNVLDTIAIAVAATADAATQRGADAYLLVVTDGGDVASVGSIDALVAEATARQVKLLVVGVGPQERIATNAAMLTTLASRTNGAYIGNPTSDELKDFYRNHVSIVGQSAYLLRYTTDILDDGQTHNLAIRVDGSASGESPPIPLLVNVNVGDVTGSMDLGPVLQAYAIRAIPLVIICSLIITALLAVSNKVSKGRSSSLSGGITRT